MKGIKKTQNQKRPPDTEGRRKISKSSFSPEPVAAKHLLSIKLSIKIISVSSYFKDWTIEL